MNELVGGLTNQLFLCEDGESGEKVVYRVYGMIQDDPYERMVELSICTLLGANKIGPNILGETEHFKSSCWPTIVKVSYQMAV